VDRAASTLRLISRDEAQINGDVRQSAAAAAGSSASASNSCYPYGDTKRALLLADFSADVMALVSVLLASRPDRLRKAQRNCSTSA
jgi:hypothetical protein